MVEYIRYTIDTGRADAFEQAYRYATESLDASEHCERYEIARCTEDPTQEVVRIEWDSEEDTCPASGGAPSVAALRVRSARS
jgi:heme-degrading monooxygenase HmoA